jgi:hypothetical protein
MELNRDCRGCPDPPTHRIHNGRALALRLSPEEPQHRRNVTPSTTGVRVGIICVYLLNLQFTAALIETL